MADKNRYNLSPYNRIPPPDNEEVFEAAEGILTIVKGGEDIPVSEYRNFYIDHKQDGRDWLGFMLPVESDLYREISEETKVRYRGVDYLVKKISDGHLECEIDLDFLKKVVHENYTSSVTLSSLMASILPSGWTIHGAASIHGTPVIERELCTNLDILTDAQEAYRCWFSWNHAAKTCTVTSADAVIRTGEYVTDELNLRTLSFKGSSVNFCTRLYAYGKGGVSIESVNAGKKYLDDFTYSSKLIVGYFKCDYELPANIKKAAQYELALRSQPERSYECDVVDLAKLSQEYGFLDFQIHRTVTLIDTERGIKLDHRIVEYVEYPDEPHRNTVTLARAVRKMAQIREVIKKSVDEVKIQVAEVNAAMAQNVTEIQANINAVSANVASVNANVASINANVGTVVNDIATLNTKTASLNSRVNSVETAHVSLTQTVSSQGAAINGVVTWQATTYVNDRQETANSLAAINATATSQGAQITALASWKDTTYVNDRQVVNEALAAINATANAQGASISSLTTWKSTTYVNDRAETAEALAAINQTATSMGASITSLTTWKDVTYVNDQKRVNEALTAINQTASSQGAQITALASWKDTTYASDHQTITEAIAAINATATSQGASITSLVTWKNETYACDKQATQTALAAINQTVSSQGASISTLTEWKSSATTAIASAWNTANEAGAAAGYVVEKTTNGHKLKASIVIEAINNESTAAISADRINFTGFTTFVRPSDLEGGGSVTTINGGLITTETIDVGSIKKSTVTNGSRAVVFDVGIQTSYVRTNDITATGQLNLGATLVAVGSALTVNGKNVLVEGDVDLTGYATQTWSNNAFAVKDHTHAGYLNYSSANTTTLVVSKVGSSDHYNIALIGHGHSNYALSNHTHEGMATQEWVGSQAFATQNWANNAFAASDHTHAGLLNFKSANTTAIVFTSVGATTQYSAAAVGHGHSNYAASDHTHEGMATQSWANGAFASTEHSHAGTLAYKSANSAFLIATSVGDAATYSIALAGHGHSNYALSTHGHSNYSLSTHEHTGTLAFDSTAGTTLVIGKVGGTATYNVALANHAHSEYAASSHTHSEYSLSTHGHSNYSLSTHSHSNYAASDHTHTGYLSFKSTAGTTLNIAKVGTTTAYYDVALANHTHDGFASASHDHIDYLKFFSTTGTNVNVGRITSTFTSYMNLALANHTHSNYAASDHSHTGMFSYGSTAGTNLTMAREGSTTTYTVALANHAHSEYISSSDVSGHLVYSSISGKTLVATSVGSTTKINIALANHTHDDISTTDHMKFKSTTGANVTLTRLGATLNTDYTFSLANHTHDGYAASDHTHVDSFKFKSTTGANITLTRLGQYANTDYTFSLANHTHDNVTVNYAGLMKFVNVNATSAVLNIGYVSYNAYGTSSQTNYSVALANHTHNDSWLSWYSNNTTYKYITFKQGSTFYYVAQSDHTHSAYLSNSDLNGKWYVNINGTKYYLRSP